MQARQLRQLHLRDAGLVGHADSLPELGISPVLLAHGSVQPGARLPLVHHMTVTVTCDCA